MRERSRVEVKLHVMLLTPFNPTLEVFRFYLIAVNHLALEISVNLMQVQAVSTWNIRSGFQDVGTQLINQPANSGVTGENPA